MCASVPRCESASSGSRKAKTPRVPSARGTSGVPRKSDALDASSGSTSEMQYAKSASALSRESNDGCGRDSRKSARTVAGDKIRHEFPARDANAARTSAGASSMRRAPSARSAAASAGGASPLGSGKNADRGAVQRTMFDRGSIARSVSRRASDAYRGGSASDHGSAADVATGNNA